MYCEYYKLTFRQAWSPVLKGLVAWQRVPKWRPRGPRFKTTVSGQWSVIFSHISIFSNMMTNPWIAGINCRLNKSDLETWMQRSSSGEEYGNCKQSDSSVGIEYFTGDSRSLHWSGYEFCSVDFLQSSYKYNIWSNFYIILR